MTISRFISEARGRNQLLFMAGALSAVLFVLFFTLSLFDERTVLGANTWVKPMKFVLSFLVFSWTFAWILVYLPDKKKVRLISRGLVLCMAAEILPIAIQASRGVPSHFNTSTLFDIAVFQVMGFFILLNTIIVIYCCIQFFKPTPGLRSDLRLSIQAGLVLFILGAISGGMMVGLSAHSVGEADGGDGIPFLNWNTNSGDLRVAHFFTLHGLQFVPILVYLAGLVKRSLPMAILVISLYSALCLWLHAQALNAAPFLSLTR